MKKQIFSVLAVVIALAASFAFIPAKFEARQATALFQLNDPAAPKDPTKYTPFVGNPLDICPGGTKICVIEVRNPTDIYPANHPVVAFRGKPKVDINPLSTEIDLAVASAANPYVAPATGNRYWKKP